MIGIASQAPPTWEFSGRAGKVALARHDEFIAVSGVQKPTAALEQRVAAVKELFRRLRR